MMVGGWQAGNNFKGKWETVMEGQGAGEAYEAVCKHDLMKTSKQESKQANKTSKQDKQTRPYEAVCKHIMYVFVH